MFNPLLLDIPDHIETERLLIRSPRAGDGATIHAAVMETIDSLREWMDWAVTEQTVEGIEEYARNSAVNFLARREFNLSLWLKDGETFVGASGIHNVDWSVPKMELGYWCRKRFEGQGYISEAVRGITRFAFEELGARRLEIRCDARNERSANVARRSGYRLEGQFRHNELDTSGELRDTLIFARLPSDPSPNGER